MIAKSVKYNKLVVVTNDTDVSCFGFGDWHMARKCNHFNRSD